MAVPQLTIAMILDWVDTHYRRYGRWPRRDSGRIAGGLGITWMAVDMALKNRGRGLTVQSSLPQLLAEHRGVRNRSRLPAYTVKQILAWADEHRQRTGDWPHADSGPIHGAPGETWRAVQQALVNGRRGLVAGSSLRRVLSAHRGCRNFKVLPPLRPGDVLRWAEAHRRLTGNWPRRHSGPIPEAPLEENWATIDAAFVTGTRGLDGYGSLSRFLAHHRGVNGYERPRLTIKQILEWADAHHVRAGRWPTHKSGRIVDAPRGTWYAVEQALRMGHRGLPGGSSLYKVLVRYRRIDRDK